MRVLGLVIMVPSLPSLVFLALSFSVGDFRVDGVLVQILCFCAFWAIVGTALVFLGETKGWFCKACGTSITEHITACPKCNAEFDLPS